MKATCATYLYCLVRKTRRPSLAGAPRGLAGSGRPRVIGGEGGLWLVVGDAPLAIYGAAAIERGLRDLSWVSACALAHEAVVEHCARAAGRAATVAPMKLFTAFAGDGRAIAHVARARRKIGRALDLVAGCQEWGVRVGLDEARALAGMRAETRAVAGSSGAGFLAAKRAERDAAGKLQVEARRAIDRLFDELSGSARRAVARPPAQNQLARRVILDAVFLVPSTGARRFQSHVARIAAHLPEEVYPLTLSGPWPPYSFLG